MTLGYKTTAQTKQDFDAKLQNHIQSFLMDNQKVEKWKKENTAPFIKLDPTENEDMLNRLVTELKHKYIIDNMDEYKRAYFPEEFVANMMMTDTFICDNGGFESDFLYYKGYSTLFDEGSTTCNLVYNYSPVIYVPTTLPTVRQFEIVSTGTDVITGIQKVKFGSKSLKLNDPYNHNLGGIKCYGSHGVNKITKRFKVTEENRDFTVWYSIALENPTGHTNTQPFFNINCDLAPLSTLCFDAAILDCDSLYNQPDCGNNLMDVLDWSCHRIKIPADEVGNIATLEIIMGDCGESQHNGYAYIDGICEDCNGSALGSLTLSEDSLDLPDIGIQYITCNGDFARICGRYTEPFVCGEWYLDSIAGVEDTIVNYSIDTLNKIFCFDLNISNFGSTQDSLELYIAGFFKRNGGGTLPGVFSNSIKIKKSLFTKKFDVGYYIGECQNNSDPDDNNISDDYYFIDVFQYEGYSESWSIDRHLIDPYQNESGITNLGSGNGPFNLHLGPFLIQEGSWELVVTIDTCTYIFVIDPPDFCSGCAAFHDLEIGNVTCVSPGNRWSFSFIAPGNDAPSSKFEFYEAPDFDTPLFDDFYDSPQTIGPALIGFDCKTYRIQDVSISTCFVEFTVCPPKPCTENCDLEVNVSKVECVRHNTDDYYITLDVDASGTVCYTTDDITAGLNNSPVPTGGLIPSSFDDDVTIVVFLCPGGVCSLCVAPVCYKVLKVFQPECESEDYGGIADKISSTESIDKAEIIHDVTIVPNPVNGNEVKIISKLPNTVFEIFDNKGQKIFGDSFDDYQYIWETENLPSGIYFLQYFNSNQKKLQIPFIKQ